jgi:hypothetical protein
MPDVFFPSYQFRASPGSYNSHDLALRTLPDRLSDIVNVKDWGAKGDGSNDTAAINAAIAYANTVPNGANAGCTVFFPPGNYYIGTPPLFCDPVGREPLWFVGAGRDVTTIFGNYYTGQPADSTNNSFLVCCGRNTTQGNGTVIGFRDLSIINNSTGDMSGALVVEASGNRFRTINCRFKGVVAFNHSAHNNFGSYHHDCVFECTRPITAANAAARTPLFDFSKIVAPTGAAGDPTYVSNYSISVGCGISQGTLINCQAIGFDIGFATSFIAPCLIGCVASRCGIGIMGFNAGSARGDQDISGNNIPYPARIENQNGYHLCSNRIERCTWGINMASLGGIIAANAFVGGRCGDQAIASPYDPVPIQSIQWNSSTHVVTVMCAQAHNISTGARLQLAWIPPSAQWTTDPYGFVTVASTPTSTTFTYAGPSSDPGSFNSGTWNYALQYALFVHGEIGAACLAANALDGAEAAIASFSLLSPSGISFGDYYRTMVMAMRGGHPWTTKASNNGGLQYRQCGTAGANLNPSQFLPFNQLPGSGGGNASQFEPATEGMTRNVIDCQSQASFGGIVSGGGSSNHYKVRYDGTNWIRVG